MSILGRLLTLVACVPLLLPPGYCVCEAGDTGCMQPSRAKVAGTITPPPSHKTEGCSHRHVAQTVSGTALGDQPPQGPAAPIPNDHSPGCPAASPAVERLQWSDPTPGVTAALLPVAFVALEPAPVAARPADRPCTRRHAAPPLYLSHCSLVI